MKIIIINISVALLLIFIFDVFAFLFVPDNLTNNFLSYRKSPPPNVGGRGRYPNNYFIKDHVRGFDLGRNRSGNHWVDGVTYPVWSNSLGCYDIEHTNINEYVYFAGDSFTWGYTPFEKKFGTVIERNSNTSIFKCGVTHTGQKHQLDKMIQVTKEFGKHPKALFVFYTPNDVINDHAYPQATIINGWLVDKVYADSENNIIKHNQADLVKKVDNVLGKIRKYRENRAKKSRLFLEIKQTLKYYSLTINLLYQIKNAVAVKHERNNNDDSKSQKTYKNVGFLPREKNGRYWFKDNPIANSNKMALLKFRDFAVKNKAELFVILITSKDNYKNSSYYNELKEYLNNNNIKHLDLANEFVRRGIDDKTIYWDFDGHYNPSGNEILADILMSKFPSVFK